VKKADVLHAIVEAMADYGPPEVWTESDNWVAALAVGTKLGFSEEELVAAAEELMRQREKEYVPPVVLTKVFNNLTAQFYLKRLTAQIFGSDEEETT